MSLAVWTGEQSDIEALIGRSPVMRIAERQHVRDEVVHLALVEVEIHVGRIVMRTAQPVGKRFGGQALLIGDGPEWRGVGIWR